MKDVYDERGWQPDCIAQHMGLWLIEPFWFRQATDAVVNGAAPRERRVQAYDEPAPNAATVVREGASGPIMYTVDRNGIAHMSIMGQMQKGDSKFGGASTVRLRRSMRAAAADPDVGGIMLRMDSPGGTVAGTEEAANDVRAVAAQKPVFTQIEDLGASAAYWLASQTTRIAANATAEIGSIGTVAVVYDTSEAAAQAGVKVEVVSTGAYKGAFAEGAPVMPEHLEYLRDRVDAANGYFVEAVRSGRKMTTAAVQKSADGRVFSAADAQSRGLIDAVQGGDATLADLVKETKARARTPRRASKRARIAQMED